MNEKEMFDGGKILRRTLRYVEPTIEAPSSFDVVTGRHGGFYRARIFSIPEGEELYDFRDGTRYPVCFDDRDSPERAEAFAVEGIRKRLAASGARLLIDS